MANLDFHLVKSIRDRVAKGGEKVALRHKVADVWKGISWKQFGEQLDALSLALLAQGIKVQDKVGIYSNKKQYHEENIEYSEDFLGGVCKDWEDEALKANEYGVRTAIFRFGIVMGEGGALAKMLIPFKLGVGGTIGDGSQAFSFIHIDDLINAYKFVIENENMQGAYNLTAPIPTTNKGLTKALGNTLNRPTILPVPQFALNLIFSEGAKVLTDGQSVLPQRLLDAGFKFKYKTIEETIENLLGDN